MDQYPPEACASGGISDDRLRHAPSGEAAPNTASSSLWRCHDWEELFQRNPHLRRTLERFAAATGVDVRFVSRVTPRWSIAYPLRGKCCLFEQRGECDLATLVPLSREVPFPCRASESACPVCRGGKFHGIAPVQFRSQTIGYLRLEPLRASSIPEPNGAVADPIPSVATARADGLVYLLWQLLRDVEAHLHSTDLIQPPLPPLARRVAGLIEARYSEPLTVAAIAAELRVSPSHLTREFRKATGEGVLQFLTAHRIRVACQALIETGLTVGEVAFASGFQSLPQFYRCFRKHTAATPQRWREENRRKPETARE